MNLIPSHRYAKLRKLLGDLITMIQECFPRTDGWGWKLPKMHAFAKMPHYMLRFGSANNFSGQIGERALKAIEKNHAARTQRRPANFAEQCAIREYENNVITYVMTDLRNQLGVSAHKRARSVSKCELRGRFTLTLSETNNRGIGVSQDLVSWHNIKKDKIRCHVSDLFIFAIRRYSHVNGYTDKFNVTGYTTYYAVNNSMDDTSMDDTIKYYATEYMNGEKRYDFAMINFVSDEGMTATCPAKILGFVRYNITKGIPTPQFAGDEELSLRTIRENDTVEWWFILHPIMSRWSNYKVTSLLRLR
jgi:hypothetical protein